MSSNSVYVILDDFVKILIRGFYGDEYAVVIDGLLREKRRITEEQLSQKLRIPQKLVRKVLSDLRNDSLVKSSESKIDPKPGEKSTTQILWYIEYKHIIDVVKFKIYMIKKKMEIEKSTKLDVQSYKCASCLTVYTAYDMAKLIAEGKVTCEYCNGKLEEEHNNESLTETTKHQSVLWGHMKKLVDQLRKTEGLQIPLFARDTAENPQDNFHNFTINTGAQNVNTTKASAFRSSTSITTPQPTNNSNLEFNIEICETDNIDEMNKNVKKENKKTGLASLPPWLLPSNSILNKTKTKLSDRINQPKEAPKPEAIVKKEEIFDKDLYEDYIKSHFREWESAENANKRIKLENDVKMEENSDPMNIDSNDMDPDEIIVLVGGKQVSISDITDEDQEKMSAQEYEDFHYKLYNYASKCMSVSQ
ncbi:transcription factor IIE [Tieghemostelium lacteum]|uniref:Transcription factor IIE n=1 Tax=Tieghemostelium lacteum TaxID=361077 RepID=A0A151ZBY7_TIELA|nr:transcription factor IIE [Tieghemostelium lacteum]|eukprot:KYQ91449.1 transcription factor IIE [Tieghemostelium lacteum]